MAAPTSEDVIAIRRRHLGREANIRAVAILMYVQAALAVVYGAIIAIAPIGGWLSRLIAPREEPSELSFWGEVGIVVLLTLLGVALAALGVWVWRGASDLRRYSPTGRPAGYVWSVINLINIPVGTLISLAMLAFLSDEKGKFVLSPEYREIVSKTPQISTSGWVFARFVLFPVFTVMIIFGLALLIGGLRDPGELVGQ